MEIMGNKNAAYEQRNYLILPFFFVKGLGDCPGMIVRLMAVVLVLFMEMTSNAKKLPRPPKDPLSYEFSDEAKFLTKKELTALKAEISFLAWDKPTMGEFYEMWAALRRETSTEQAAGLAAISICKWLWLNRYTVEAEVGHAILTEQMKLPTPMRALNGYIKAVIARKSDDGDEDLSGGRAAARIELEQKMGPYLGPIAWRIGSSG